MEVVRRRRLAGANLGRASRALARLLVAALAVVLVGCSGEDEPDAAAPPVERFARQIADAGGERVIVFVSDDGREYEAAAGSGRPRPDERFRIGSVTARAPLGAREHDRLPGLARPGKSLAGHASRGHPPLRGLAADGLRARREVGLLEHILDYATLVRATEGGERVAVVSVHGGTLTGEPPDETALLCPPPAS